LLLAFKIDSLLFWVVLAYALLPIPPKDGSISPEEAWAYIKGKVLVFNYVLPLRSCSALSSLRLFFPWPELIPKESLDVGWLSKSLPDL